MLSPAGLACSRLFDGAAIMTEELCVQPVSRVDLRADHAGTLIAEMAALAYAAFREPPWNDTLEVPRLHFGLGVDLMRRNALALVAKAGAGGELAGYLLGYEVFRQSDDGRELTLAAIAGSDALDYLFDGDRRVFYEDTVCVAAHWRRQSIARRLSTELISRLPALGFTDCLGRTARSAVKMRALYRKLGFVELPVHDAAFPDRTYWLLDLRRSAEQVVD